MTILRCFKLLKAQRFVFLNRPFIDLVISSKFYKDGELITRNHQLNENIINMTCPSKNRHIQSNKIPCWRCCRCCGVTRYDELWFETTGVRPVDIIQSEFFFTSAYETTPTPHPLLCSLLNCHALCQYSRNWSSVLKHFFHTFINICASL